MFFWLFNVYVDALMKEGCEIPGGEEREINCPLVCR